MLSVEKIDTQNQKHVRRFLDLPFRLYRDTPLWVPPLRSDIATMLDRKKHPLYEHSDADFFLVSDGKRDVARVAMVENRPYNRYHETRIAQFYLLEFEEDAEALARLFDAASAWARARGLEYLVGPKGFGPADGYGIMVEGFDKRPMMTMMKYNFPYYPPMLEALGFQKEVDFVSCYLSPERFRLPDRVRRIAERVKARGSLQVKQFKDKRELKSWVQRIGKAYNQTFVNNWEYYPLTQRELDFVFNTLIMVADHRLFKVILHEEEVVGFLFAFPDVSHALQRARGRLTPWALVDLLRELRRTRWIAFNGAGILPEFHGMGGNALLYAEVDNSMRDFNFEHAVLCQVAESARQMRNDLENLGGLPYMNHRVYRKAL